MELIDVVRRLTGPIQPVGETNEDSRRLKNLIAVGELVSELIYDIQRAAEYAGSHEQSVQTIGKTAEHFLSQLKSA